METNTEEAEVQTQEASGSEEAQEVVQETPYALLFELENIASVGRQSAFDVLKSILGEHKLKIEPSLFSSFAVNTAPDVYVPAILNAAGGKLAADKLAEDVRSGVVMHLSSNAAGLRPGVAEILDEAKKRGMKIGTFSSLPQSDAESVVKKLGLEKWDVELFASNAKDHVVPRSDCWVKIARALDRKPRCCIVLVSEKASLRAALSASMRSVVVPDQFTSFQDFGGSDLVLDSLADVPAGELLDQLCSEPLA